VFQQREGIAPKRIRVSRPLFNGNVERLHRKSLDEHFRVEGRGTWVETVEKMQVALDATLVTDDTKRPHQGLGMNGRTPAKAFVQGIANTSRQEEPEKLKAAA